jgi:hypothetical protein
MWFSSIDTDRNGELDAGEIQRALALGNLKFSTQGRWQVLCPHLTHLLLSVQTLLSWMTIQSHGVLCR